MRPLNNALFPLAVARLVRADTVAATVVAELALEAELEDVDVPAEVLVAEVDVPVLEVLVEPPAAAAMALTAELTFAALAALITLYRDEVLLPILLIDIIHPWLTG